MRKLFIAAVAVAVCFSSCDSTEPAENQQTSIQTEEPEAKETPTNNLRQYSELALVMRDMFDRLELAKGYIKRGEAIPDSLNLDFSKIHSAERQEGMGEGNAFDGYATLFLNSMDSLSANQDVETFNAMVNSCVDCHNTYCTGAIRKIKKLEIPEM